MELKRSKAEWMRRYASFVIILFVIALGAESTSECNITKYF